MWAVLIHEYVSMLYTCWTASKKTTLHPALSVRWSVGTLYTILAFLSFLSIQLLPRCPSDLPQHCSCPPARALGSHVPGLVDLCKAGRVPTPRLTDSDAANGIRSQTLHSLSVEKQLCDRPTDGPTDKKWVIELRVRNLKVKNHNAMSRGVLICLYLNIIQDFCAA